MSEEEEKIKFHQLLAHRAALKAEIAGMKRSKGASVYKLVKEQYDLKGTRKQVLKKLNEEIECQIKNRQQPSSVSGAQTSE